MLESLFPISEYWSWWTFALYVSVSILVTLCCKKGAKYAALSKAYSCDNKYKARRSTEMSNLFYLFAFLVLVLLATLRTSEVGPDTKVYVNYFENMRTFAFDWSKFSSFQQMEPAFQCYLWLMQRVTTNYHIFFLVTYTFVAGAYVKYIKYFFDEKSNYMFLQLFIFFYVSNMSGMRAALGTVFLLYSYIKIEEEKYSKAALLTFVACMFHYSLLYNFYIIIATWIYKKPTFRRKKWLWVFMLIATAGLASTGVAFLKNLFADTKYGYYSLVSISEQSLLGSVFYLIYAIVCFANYKTILNSRKKIQGQLIETVCFLITYPVIYVTAAYRIPNYYALPRLTIWSEATDILIKKGKNQQQRFIIKVIIETLIIFYLLFRFTRSATDGSFTYLVEW